MDKNSTSSTLPYLSSESKPYYNDSPSASTLAQVRQFARAYVHLKQVAPVGGIILN